MSRSILLQGETLGLVGESGCGKTTLGRMILRLIEPTSGSIRFQQPRCARRRQAANCAAYAAICRPFSGPCLAQPAHARGRNRDRTAGHSRRHRHKRRPISCDLNQHTNLHQAAIDILRAVGLDESGLRRYPHEFSGGQRQRIGIARALVLRPKFVVCDEPVSALDVSVGAQIVNLLRKLQRDFGLTYLFISHSMPVVRYLCDRIAVMRRGEIVEIGPAEEITSRPQHEYTRTLLTATPEPEFKLSRFGGVSEGIAERGAGAGEILSESAEKRVVEGVEIRRLWHRPLCVLLPCSPGSSCELRWCEFVLSFLSYW